MQCVSGAMCVCVWQDEILPADRARLMAGTKLFSVGVGSHTALFWWSCCECVCMCASSRDVCVWGCVCV